MTSSADLITAARDTDLRDRAAALLAATGHTTPEATVTQMMGRLVAVTVGDQGQSIADVLAYAIATYAPTPRPGQNPAAVTDEQLITALRAVGAIPEEV